MFRQPANVSWLADHGWCADIFNALMLLITVNTELNSHLKPTFLEDNIPV